MCVPPTEIRPSQCPLTCDDGVPWGRQHLVPRHRRVVTERATTGVARALDSAPATHGGVAPVARQHLSIQRPSRAHPMGLAAAH
jgi:hypothetical protein